MTPEHFIKAELVSLAWRHGHSHGGIDNMRAVCFVARNRQRAGWLGGSWREIISRADDSCGTHYEFEAMTELQVRDTQFRILLQQVDDIYSGAMPDPLTAGGLYYAELNKVDSLDFLHDIVRDPQNHPRVATIGNVSFFK